MSDDKEILILDPEVVELSGVRPPPNLPPTSARPLLPSLPPSLLLPLYLFLPPSVPASPPLTPLRGSSPPPLPPTLFPPILHLFLRPHSL